MIKKSKHVLPDTVVIINAHEFEYWNSLCNTYKIAIPGTIIEEEAFYFQSDRGKLAMKPNDWINQKKVARIDAELIDFASLNHKVTTDFLASLDRGEIEAIAILMSKKYDNILFTTGDRAAIKALGVLGLSERGISVEELLEESKIKRKEGSKLPRHLTKKFFREALQEGIGERHIWLKSPLT